MVYKTAFFIMSDAKEFLVGRYEGDSEINLTVPTINGFLNDDNVQAMISYIEDIGGKNADNIKIITLPEGNFTLICVLFPINYMFSLIEKMDMFEHPMVDLNWMAYEYMYKLIPKYQQQYIKTYIDKL